MYFGLALHAGQEKPGESRRKLERLGGAGEPRRG